ncbi:hypothetical protein DY000_02055594 [Brassica cretica]|uniref:Uncharacterized protein n=1 Tax=Brassica cretica TaxID=69181 RepID=A0ABQ7A6H1_BRACR|nr:hypothetical protein DY000_02055594 [Brassica cretica]
MWCLSGLLGIKKIKSLWPHSSMLAWTSKIYPNSDAVCQAILQAIDAPLIGRLEILGAFAKWPQENEWMTDPIAIGDIDGPEIQTALSLGSLTKRNLFVFALNLCLSFFSTGSGLCGGWWIHIVPWMVVDDDSRLHQDLVASGT